MDIDPSSKPPISSNPISEGKIQPLSISIDPGSIGPTKQNSITIQPVLTKSPSSSDLKTVSMFSNIKTNSPRRSSSATDISSASRNGSFSPSNFKKFNISAALNVPSTFSSPTYAKGDSIIPTSPNGQDEGLSNSRLLDEIKRKEMWNEFRSIEMQQSKESSLLLSKQHHISKVDGENDAPTDGDGDKNTDSSKENEKVVGSRLNTLMETLRAEVATSRSPIKSPSKTMRAGSYAARGNGSATTGILKDTATTGDNHGNRGTGLVIPKRRDTTFSAPGKLTTTVLKTKLDTALKEREKLQELVESQDKELAHATVDKETIKALNEKIAQIPSLEKEIRQLKDSIQKQSMQEMSAKENIKILEDQLQLTAQSESRLRMQTTQLMQQNESLQHDLLEKIVQETSKIQQMEALSSEKMRLIEELNRRDRKFAQLKNDEDNYHRCQVLRRLFVRRRQRMLQLSTTIWRTDVIGTIKKRRVIYNVLASLVSKFQSKQKMRRFCTWKLQVSSLKYKARETALSLTIDDAQARIRKLSIWQLLITLQAKVRNRELQKKSCAFAKLLRHRNSEDLRLADYHCGISLLCQRFASWKRVDLQSAFQLWKYTSKYADLTEHYEHTKSYIKDMKDAKDCLLSVTSDKRKLEDDVQELQKSVQHQLATIHLKDVELNHMKHNFVAFVLRENEKKTKMDIFQSWKAYVLVSQEAKSLNNIVTLSTKNRDEAVAQIKILEEVNAVLKSDLERFQFFSQDKRITVDVLSKKLIREEERMRNMEEKLAIEEEKCVRLTLELNTLLNWSSNLQVNMEYTVAVPSPLLSLCKDIAMHTLHQLFLAHTVNDNSYRVISHCQEKYIPVERVNQLLEATAALTMRIDNETISTDWKQVYSAIFNSNFDLFILNKTSSSPCMAIPGFTFPEFVMFVQKIANEICDDKEQRLNRMKVFYAQIISLLNSGEELKTAQMSKRANSISNLSTTSSQKSNALTGTVFNAINNTQASSNIPDYTTSNALNRSMTQVILRTAMSTRAGKLSEEILQNQDRLLAVLEHETAVVERAVMEKASLKHTYPLTESETASVAVVTTTSPCSAQLSQRSLDTECNLPTLPIENGNEVPKWAQTGPVRDLCLAFEQPLRKILNHYALASQDIVSSEYRNMTMPSTSMIGSKPNVVVQSALLAFNGIEYLGVVKMLEDMQIAPNYLTHDKISRLFNEFASPESASQRPILLPQQFIIFFAACATELYAMSKREISRCDNTMQDESITNDKLKAQLTTREIILSFFCDLGLAQDSELLFPNYIAFVGVECENILWPLFEYYASSCGSLKKSEATLHRIKMSENAFATFMSEIASYEHSEAIQLYHQVMSHQIHNKAFDAGGMHFDEFYVAISFAQSNKEADSTKVKVNEQSIAVDLTKRCGDLVRRWMQQTQL